MIIILEEKYSNGKIEHGEMNLKGKFGWRPLNKVEVKRILMNYKQAIGERSQLKKKVEDSFIQQIFIACD